MCVPLPPEDSLRKARKDANTQLRQKFKLDSYSMRRTVTGGNGSGPADVALPAVESRLAKKIEPQVSFRGLKGACFRERCARLYLETNDNHGKTEQALLSMKNKRAWLMRNVRWMQCLRCNFSRQPNLYQTRPTHILFFHQRVTHQFHDFFFKKLTQLTVQTFIISTFSLSTAAFACHSHCSSLAITLRYSLYRYYELYPLTIAITNITGDVVVFSLFDACCGFYSEARPISTSGATAPQAKARSLVLCSRCLCS